MDFVSWITHTKNNTDIDQLGDCRHVKVCVSARFGGAPVESPPLWGPVPLWSSYPCLVIALNYAKKKSQGTRSVFGKREKPNLSVLSARKRVFLLSNISQTQLATAGDLQSDRSYCTDRRGVRAIPFWPVYITTSTMHPYSSWNKYPFSFSLRSGNSKTLNSHDGQYQGERKIYVLLGAIAIVGDVGDREAGAAKFTRALPLLCSFWFDSSLCREPPTSRYEISSYFLD